MSIYGLREKLPYLASSYARSMYSTLGEIEIAPRKCAPGPGRHLKSGSASNAMLTFPDDPRPSLYAGDLARHVAISPDRTKIAVAYGVRYRSDGLAFFGVYALADGRRLATFRGDVYRGGYWESRRTLDVASASMAPLEGGLEFSADSRALYATSRYLRRWDVSALR